MISSSNEIFFNVHVAEILYVGIIIQRTETKRRIKCMPFVSNLSNAFFNVNSHTHTHACVCDYVNRSSVIYRLIKLHVSELVLAVAGVIKIE